MKNPSSRFGKLARLALVVCSLATVAVAPPASAAPSSNNLPIGNSMYNGQSFTQFGLDVGYWTLTFTTGGQLVETAFPGYGRPSRVCWRSSNPVGAGYRATYQNDGNFVIYTATGKALWASNTVGVPGQNVNINRIGRIYVGQQPISPTCGL